VAASAHRIDYNNTDSPETLMTRLALILAAAVAISPAASAAPNDYADANNWLCRPGMDKAKNACEVDLTATVIAADGKTSVEKWQANPQAEIDCFYVYPTVSLDTTPNSDMIAGPEERNVVHQQLARFGSQCRIFAPLYRQLTLPALRNMLGGQQTGADMQLGYNDVLDAWNHYLKHDNQGRGVVLIGHSQGSSMLTQLISREIDGKPVQSQMISALLLGWNLAVPKDKDVGGAFKNIPLCKAVNQTGCTIVYASFRSTVPPPANTLFGKVPGENMQAACVNPAAIGSGPGVLDAYMSTTIRGSDANVWVSGQPAVTTPFVKVPGFLTGECVTKNGATYLEVTVNGNPADPRVDDITGDVIANGQVQANWGLHLIDANLGMGNLVDIVAEQSKMYMKNCACKKK
jgi:hypothetical protein